jgi:predicted Rossmann fold flavoprotein
MSETAETGEPKSDERYDAIVVGAGAAGLLAATRLGELWGASGRRVLCVEKNRKAGVKILISGGTRCNLTHDCDRRGILEAFGSAGSFLHSPLAALGPRELVTMFNDAGLPTYVEPGTGKIFPASDRALDVVRVLVEKLRRSGAELSLGESVTAIERSGEGFRVLTETRTLHCERLLVAVGGRSYPGCGTTGDGYAWMEKLGHTIRRPRPALVPLVSDEPWIRDLSGIAIPDTLLRVMPRDATVLEGASAKRRRPGSLPPGVLIERRGALLFTHFGLSGPAALDVSRAVTGATTPQAVRLVADFLPDVTIARLDEQLREAAARDGRKQMIAHVPELLPRRLVEALYAQAGLSIERRAAEFGNADRRKLAEVLKGATLLVSGSRGFEKAEVTAGGVALDEVDSRTMESKLVPNLYLAGEILDLDGFIGGYNFQAAFATGYLAAQSMKGSRNER